MATDYGVVTEVVTYLESKLGVRCASEVPSTRPARFVVVERMGGNSDRWLDQPRLDIDAWATSDLEASLLIDSVEKAMDAIADTSLLISHAYMSAKYKSDIDGAHRYTASFIITRNK